MNFCDFGHYEHGYRIFGLAKARICAAGGEVRVDAQVAEVA